MEIYLFRFDKEKPFSKMVAYGSFAHYMFENYPVSQYSFNNWQQQLKVYDNPENSIVSQGEYSAVLCFEYRDVKTGEARYGYYIIPHCLFSLVDDGFVIKAQPFTSDKLVEMGLGALRGLYIVTEQPFDVRRRSLPELLSKT